MRLITLVFILSLNAGLLVSANANAQSGASTEIVPGKVIGVWDVEHPAWFKQSFLEIAEDAAEAGAENKHVLLYFHLKDCPYCAKMVEENFINSSYSQFLQDNFDIIALNVKGDREVAFIDTISLREKELAQHLQIQATPTLVFLDNDNKPVLRLNGYRSVARFKYALDFVHEKAYQHTQLARYIETKLPTALYQLRDHPNFSRQTDLASLTDKPVALLFEDRTCDACAELHERILNQPETLALLDNFTAVRLDALSATPIIGVDGHKTTAKAYAETLNLSYRPGLVLFDQGREIMRIDSMLRTFHFQEVLRYVGEQHYQTYPLFRDYSRLNQERILNSGQNIDIWK